MRLLFIGDIVGKGGREAVKQLVPELRREFNCQFVIANAENSAAGNGLTAGCARELLTVADVLTSGDHTWDQKGFDADIRQFPQIIRRASPAAAGVSSAIRPAATSPSSRCLARCSCANRPTAPSKRSNRS